MQDRSLTVPQMLSLPILPPGNSGGETMKPSVVKARLVPPMDSGVVPGELGIGKMSFKDTVDEFGSLFAAGAVG